MINFTGTVSIPLFVANVNDFDPGTQAALGALVWSIGTSVGPGIEITGIIAPTLAGAYVSKTLILINNRDLPAITLKNNSVSSAAVNRLGLPNGDVVLGPGDAVQLIYNPLTATLDGPRWHQVVF